MKRAWSRPCYLAGVVHRRHAAVGWLVFASALVGVACGNTARDAPNEPSPDGASGRALAGAASLGGAAAGSGGVATNGGSTTILIPPLGGGSSPAEPEPEPEPEPHGPVPCEDPEPLPHGGGFERCKNGSLHRTESVACESALPRAEPASGILYDECERDQDCVESANGYCVIGACYYGCVADSECDAGGLCFCGELVGRCLSAACRTDADCPADYPCTGNPEGSGDGADFRCQTPLDTCQIEADCGPLEICSSDGTRRRCIRVGTVG